MNATESVSNPLAARPRKGDGLDGYLGSSLDLQAGLKVREILVSACPPEVVRELARMRRSWGDVKEAVAA